MAHGTPGGGTIVCRDDAVKGVLSMLFSSCALGGALTSW